MKSEPLNGKYSLSFLQMWSVKRDLIKDIILSAVFISALIHYMNFRYEDALWILFI